MKQRWSAVIRTPYTYRMMYPVYNSRFLEGVGSPEVSADRFHEVGVTFGRLREVARQAYEKARQHRQSSGGRRKSWHVEDVSGWQYVVVRSFVVGEQAGCVLGGGTQQVEARDAGRVVTVGVGLCCGDEVCANVRPIDDTARPTHRCQPSYRIPGTTDSEMSMVCS